MKSRCEKFMLDALALAAKGIGNVEPNPAVGCVIVKDGRIVGKGWHKKFGGPHAEINTLNDCCKKGNNPAGATMYVTLEPCCHLGKTPPCTDAIIKAEIAKVVIAVIDPSKHANGKGVRLLKKAGIEIETGLCEEQAKLFNAPFFKFARTGRPWVIVKWAQSKDGFLASKKQRWISNEKSRADAHKLRRRADAILVGINTVIADDPLLTARPARRGKNLLRGVLDSRLRIPLNCNLIKAAAKTPVCIFTTIDGAGIKQQGVEIVKAGKSKGRINLEEVLAELGRRNIQQLLVEGGPEVITSFLRAGLADEIIIYVAPKNLADDGLASTTKLMAGVLNRVCLYNADVRKFNGDLRIKGFIKNPLNLQNG
jgi:diaminohydroxyphosphoribosylaminopyrimidine deaminase / 5-amino-6-(5-phosphoribosylamino)uracil reductase